MRNWRQILWFGSVLLIALIQAAVQRIGKRTAITPSVSSKSSNQDMLKVDTVKVPAMNDYALAMLSFSHAAKANRIHRRKLSVYYFQEALLYLGRVL